MKRILLGFALFAATIGLGAPAASAAPSNTQAGGGVCLHDFKLPLGLLNGWAFCLPL